MHWRRILILVLMVCAGALAFWRLPHLAGGGGHSADATAQIDPAVATLFQSAFPDATGQAQKLDQWQGRWLVVNFWATWCGPCVAEMPELDQVQQKVGTGKVAIVGLGTEGLEKLRKFAPAQTLRFPLLAGGFDALGLARNLGDAQGVLPFTVLISPAGAIVHVQTGALKPGQLEQWLSAS